VVLTSTVFSQANAGGVETWIMEDFRGANAAPIQRETLARAPLAGGAYPRHAQTRTIEQPVRGIADDGTVVAGGALQVVSRVRETYGTVRAGLPKVLLEKVAGFGTPQARTTALAYYEEPGKPESYGRLKSILRPDGGWETWEYLEGAGADAVAIHRTGWLNAAFGDKTQCHEVREVDALLGDIVHSAEERVLGTLVARSWEELVKNADGTTLHSHHRLTPQGDSMERFTYYAANLNSPEGGRLKFAQHADGTVERHTYAADAAAGNAGGLVHTIERGGVPPIRCNSWE